MKLGLQETFLNRNRDTAAKKAHRRQFKMSQVIEAITNIDHSLGKVVNEMYETSIDFGAHPNPHALIAAMNIDRNEGELVTTITSMALIVNPRMVEFAMHEVAQIGLTALCIFEHVFKDRVEEQDGLRAEMTELRAAGLQRRSKKRGGVLRSLRHSCRKVTLSPSPAPPLRARPARARLAVIGLGHGVQIRPAPCRAAPSSVLPRGREPEASPRGRVTGHHMRRLATDGDALVLRRFSLLQIEACVRQGLQKPCSESGEVVSLTLRRGGRRPADLSRSRAHRGSL
jgi:hypothetical protein